MFEFELAFTLLFVKHWLCDFAWQTPRMLSEKGTYGALGGLYHSGLHAAFTFVIFTMLDANEAFLLASIDFLIHYHVDWFKVRYGTRDASTPKFWKQFGLDQLAHYFTYLLIIGMFARQEFN